MICFTSASASPGADGVGAPASVSSRAVEPYADTAEATGTPLVK